MSDKKQVDIIALFDQADTQMENIAKMLSNYRRALIDGGIPDGLADDMTLDLQGRIVPKASQYK